MLTTEEIQDMITVDMGDYKLAKGDQKLITWDLGSCVAIAVADPQMGVGGLLHIMLPKHTPEVSKEVAASSMYMGKARYMTKYADTGIEEMVEELVHKGACKTRLVAKIAGAAHMFKMAGVEESEDISSRNLEAVKKKLAELEIPILAEEVGDYYPRTVVFEPASGVFRILTLGKIDRRL